MKYLIVNGDDFGASRGINRGILEAHQRGILTSTSLLVNAPATEAAAELSRGAPDLSVGLHVELSPKALRASADVPQLLKEQFQRFQQLMGPPPTHLDSHHHVHRKPAVLPHFLALARQYGVPLRQHSPVSYFSKFYGQWGGATHLEQISAAKLIELLETQVGEGITELGCHPGYVEPKFASGYAVEREAELRALCDPLVRRAVQELSICLMSYHTLEHLLVAPVF